MKLPYHHATLPIKTSMGPQYFSGPPGIEKDYNFVAAMNGSPGMLHHSSLTMPNGHFLHGAGKPDPLRLGMIHDTNGYMQALVPNGGLKGHPPPPVPARPRNMSHHSTSSDGMEPNHFIDPTISNRTPLVSVANIRRCWPITFLQIISRALIMIGWNQSHLCIASTYQLWRHKPLENCL